MKTKRIAIFVLYVVSILIFDTLVRSIGASSDFENYELAMTMGYSEISNNFYYIKEPSLWYVQKYLYEIFGSPILAWILIDLSLVVLCVCALVQKNASPKYLLIYFLSFYSILGMFNTYRQFVALAIVGWLSVLVDVRKIVLFAMTFHWISALALFFIKITRLDVIVGLMLLMASLFLLDNSGFDIHELMSDRAAVDSGRFFVVPYTFLVLYLAQSFYGYTKSKLLLIGVVMLLASFVIGSVSQYERVLLALFQLVIPYAIANNLHGQRFFSIFCVVSLGMNLFHPTIHALIGLG